MKRFKKQAPFFGIAILLVVALVGGTFAYFSQTSTASNFLSAKNYDSTLTEAFTPPQDGNFTPGVEYAKSVGVTNSGDVGMLVRIKYEEFWNGVKVLDPLLTYADAVDGWYDGATEADSVVAKKAGLTTLNGNGDWVYGGDGYYYFTGELQPGDSTDKFIESIMLKASTLTSTTVYSVVFWNAETQAYTVAADYADDTAIAAELDALPAGSYVSSKVSNVTPAMSAVGSYELKFTAETIQSVSDAATVWQTSATTLAVDTFLGGFILP